MKMIEEEYEMSHQNPREKKSVQAATDGEYKSNNAD